MEKKNIIKVYTTSSGAELNISTPNTKQVISATNNRAQYFAELAKKYRDEAQKHSDNAKYYAEQNSDVTFEYINNVRSSLENKISEKQDAGDYALRDELPTMVGELENNMNYINLAELEMAIDEVKLPEQVGNEGKFLMTNGEKEKWVGISTFKLFDIKLSDHVLTYEESKGWALQGSYVNGAVYPDFYAKCLEEYNEATNTETINGVTVKIHSNGHKFYNISDKTAIDEFFNTIGSAWFYGVDTENERVFLPRDKYFAVKGDVSVAGNGMTLGLTNGANDYSLTGSGALPTALYGSASIIPYTSNLNAGGTHVNGIGALGLSTDPTKSGIEGKLTANEDKYLYICVGNTIVNEDQIDVSKVLSEAVLRSSLEQVQVVVETYSNGTSWYRIWSDGWCEQGGRSQCGSNINQTLTLLKDFANTNYTIQTTVDISNVTSGYNADAFIGSKTTSTVIIYCKNGSGGVLGTSYSFYWQASGYIW